MRVHDPWHRNDLAVAGAQLRRLLPRSARPAAVDRLRERNHASPRRVGPRVADDHARGAHSLSHRSSRRSPDADFRLEVRVSAVADRAGRGDRARRARRRCSSGWPRRTEHGSRRPGFPLTDARDRAEPTSSSCRAACAFGVIRFRTPRRAWHIPWSAEPVASSTRATRDHPPSWRRGRDGCDLLVCECSLPQAMGIPEHLTPEQCG